MKAGTRFLLFLPFILQNPAIGAESARQQVSEGAALYQAHCASCHGPLTSSNKRGRSAATIGDAIKKNVGGMGFLSCLSTFELQGISMALK